MVRIKICGITNAEDAQIAVNLGAHALGFVFAKSPRKISPEKAQEIIIKLPPFIFSVGVFVNEEAEKIKQIIELCKLNALQLHGEESPKFCQEFRTRVKVIKAFRIKDERDLQVLLRYDVDAYLLDAFSPTVYGGTGKTFDWDLAIKAKKILRNRPLILSGGLNPQNVKGAIEKVKPYAVDVSSGLEKSPGKKDKVLLEKFIQSVKAFP
ncbi:MAG: phosphoribosylanthranilate isomerase [Candidatus Omnitrophica bacterium]|nr:phosphoribosylanthranilate isomerase [Candidatus Omnitrophota bacterium]MCM8793341.1 phosphoribosylanthranilate isomerase [Candidatus Omnitrophota bacterium]